MELRPPVAKFSYAERTLFYESLGPEYDETSLSGIASASA